MDFLFDKNIDLLSGMLGYRSKRHQIIASNISNIDTPGFKPSDITFEKQLLKKNPVHLTTTDPAHIAPKASLPDDVPFEMTTSSEKVKIDTEMANLAENNLMYNMTVEMLARKFRGLNTVLKETK